MTLLKRTLFWVFGVMQCVYVVYGSLFSTYCTLLLLLYAPTFWNGSIFTKLIVLRSEACSDWPAIWCVVIGRIPQACDGNVTLLPYCDVVSRRDETQTIKPIINEAFVASSGDIFKHYHVCIYDRRNTNNKHYSTQLKTHVWRVSGKFFKYENILTGCESEAKLELLHFIETVFVQTAL